MTEAQARAAGLTEEEIAALTLDSGTVAAFLEPTTKRLQGDAHALYLRMINERLEDAADADRNEEGAAS